MLLSRGKQMSSSSLLARLLIEADMSQSELARRSGVTRERINHICRGRVVKIQASTIVALAWGLGIDPEELSEYIDEVPLGPRSAGGIFESIPKDWVAEYRKGRDPFVGAC